MVIKIEKKILARRLELIWIVYSLLYVILGKFYSDIFENDFIFRNVVSSSLITFAGAILASIHWLIWLEKKDDSEGKLLIISFTGLLFIIHQSIESFKDYVGAGISITIAIILFYLIWHDRKTSKKYEIIAKFTYFTILGIFIFSFIHLISSITSKLLSYKLYDNKISYVIAHHFNGILLGCLFAFMNYKFIINKVRKYRVLELLIFSVSTFVISYVNMILNYKRINLYGHGLIYEYLYSLLYTSFWVISAVIFLFYYIRKKVLTIIIICLLIPILSAFTSHVFINGMDNMELTMLSKRLILIDLPAFALLLLSLIVYRNLIRCSCALIYKNKEK